MFNKRKNHHSKKPDNIIVKTVDMSDITPAEIKEMIPFDENSLPKYPITKMIDNEELDKFDDKVFVDGPYSDIDIVADKSKDTSELMYELAKYHKEMKYGGNQVVFDEDERKIAFDRNAISEVMVAVPIRKGRVSNVIAPVVHTNNGGWRYVATSEQTGMIQDVAPVNSSVILGSFQKPEGLYTPLHDPDAIQDSIDYLTRHQKMQYFIDNGILFKEEDLK